MKLAKKIASVAAAAALIWTAPGLAAYQALALTLRNNAPTGAETSGTVRMIQDTSINAATQINPVDPSTAFDIEDQIGAQVSEESNPEKLGRMDETQVKTEEAVSALPGALIGASEGHSFLYNDNADPDPKIASSDRSRLENITEKIKSNEQITGPANTGGLERDMKTFAETYDKQKRNAGNEAAKKDGDGAVSAFGHFLNFSKRTSGALGETQKNPALNNTAGHVAALKAADAPAVAGESHASRLGHFAILTTLLSLAAVPILVSLAPMIAAAAPIASSMVAAISTEQLGLLFIVAAISGGIVGGYSANYFGKKAGYYFDQKDGMVFLGVIIGAFTGGMAASLAVSGGWLWAAAGAAAGWVVGAIIGDNYKKIDSPMPPSGFAIFFASIGLITAGALFFILSPAAAMAATVMVVTPAMPTAATAAASAVSPVLLTMNAVIGAFLGGMGAHILGNRTFNFSSKTAKYGGIMAGMALGTFLAYLVLPVIAPGIGVLLASTHASLGVSGIFGLLGLALGAMANPDWFETKIGVRSINKNNYTATMGIFGMLLGALPALLAGSILPLAVIAASGAIGWGIAKAAFKIIGFETTESGASTALLGAIGVMAAAALMALSLPVGIAALGGVTGFFSGYGLAGIQAEDRWSFDSQSAWYGIAGAFFGVLAGAVIALLIGNFAITVSTMKAASALIGTANIL